MSFFTTKWWALVLVAMLGAGLATEGYGQGATPLDGIWMPDVGGTAPSGFPDKMELLNDGTCIFEGRSASWKTSGERLFFMNIGGERGLAYNYKISNSELILINDHGQGAKYRKHLPGDKPLPTKQEQEMTTLMNNVDAMLQQLSEEGERYSKKGMYDKAIEVYTELIRINPKSVAGYLGRSFAYDNKKDYDRAIADFTMLLTLVPKGHAKVLNQRGYSYLGKGDYDKALADFNKAIQLAPNDPNMYDSRGEAYLTKGDYDKAIADYSQALRLDPNFESAKEGLAEAKKKKKGR